eukprot:g835.t1
MASKELVIPEEVKQKALALSQRGKQIQAKISELDLDATECANVLKTLKEVDTGRRCHQLINEVLVEQTVGDVLPGLQQRHDGIIELKKRLGNQLATIRKELNDMHTKYSGLSRQMTAQQARAQDEKDEDGASKSKSGGGILV